MSADTRRWLDIRLRRHGAAPLCFAGVKLLGQAGRRSVIASTAYAWHEVALYNTAMHGFVVEIVGWTKYCNLQERRVRCHAFEFSTLRPALEAFETHDPTADITFDYMNIENDNHKNLSDDTCGFKNFFPIHRIVFSFQRNYGALIGQFLYDISNKYQ